jgi:hypothetical protein
MFINFHKGELPMKNFQIELMFVALGVLLVLSTAGTLCWERVAYATDCDNGCSTTGVPCTGATVTLCTNSNGGYQGCNGSGSSKIEWSGQTSYGTTGSGGSQKITTPKILCRTVTACATQDPLYGEKCKRVSTSYSCDASGASATDICIPNYSGDVSQHEVNTCLVQACEEN